MNYLRRRFSESSLAVTEGPSSDSETHTQQAPPPVATTTANRRAGNLSAPSSPPNVRKFDDAKAVVGGFFSSFTGGGRPSDRSKCKILLVIDEPHIDWAKYFRGKRIMGDFEIRVEQAEFSELNVASYSEGGCMVDMQLVRQGTKVVRSFRPDFLLIRQHPRLSPNENYKNLIIAFMFGGVPCLNSLHSIYSFLDKPWVFSQLLQIQKRLGRDKFPLIEQAFYPNHKEMLVTPRFPIIVKIGHANNGVGKVKVNNHHEFQDIASVVAISNTYCTTEPYVESKCDIRIEMIGKRLRAFARMSASSSNWKANTGSCMLESVEVTDHFKLWIIEVSRLFGGLDVCGVSAIKAKDGRYYIIEANDCTMPLLGESQEEDRRALIDLVLNRMQNECRQLVQPHQHPGGTPHQFQQSSSLPHQTPIAQNQQQQNTVHQAGQQPLLQHQHRPPPLQQHHSAGQIRPGMTMQGGPQPLSPRPQMPGPQSSAPMIPGSGVPGVQPLHAAGNQSYPPSAKVAVQASDGGGPFGGLPGQARCPPQAKQGTSQAVRGEKPPPPVRQSTAPPQPVPGQNSDEAEISFQNLKRAFSGIFGDSGP